MGDFKEEVEEVLRLARSAAAPPAAPPRADPEGPAAAEPEAAARLERARLEGLLADLKSRNEALTRELEAQRRARDRDAGRLEELRREVRTLGESAAASRAEASAAAARAREAEETLKVTAQARLHALTALEEEKRRLESWTAQARGLKARLDSVEPGFAGKEAELRQALEQQRRGLDLEREHLLARANEATEAAELARKEGEAALKAAREVELRLGPAQVELKKVLDEERRKAAAAFESERARLYKELDEERARRRREPAEERPPSPGPSGPAAPPATPHPAPPLPAPPQPVRGLRRLALFCLAGVALAAAAVALLPAPPRRHPVPFSHPTALVWSGDELWAADWRQEAVYRLELEGGTLKVVKRYALPGTHITGMAVAGEALYLADSWKREIQLWRVGESMTLEMAWPSPGENPAALYWDGTYLWSADSPGRIFQHAPNADLTVLNTFPADFRVAAIHAAPEGFWTADSERRIIFRHRRDSTLSPIEVLSADFLDDGTGPLSAFARRGGLVWLGRDRSPEIVELPESRLSKIERR